MEQVGEQFHGLTLLSHCGGGAYGEVWYCQDISGKKLALKIVSKKKLGSQWKKELKGVQNYRKITENQLGLLQIFHVGEDEETFYYTMEPADNVGTDSYVPDTLALRLQNGPLSPEEYPAIFDEIFKGIKAIHAEGFSHCDIKPDNILFVKGKPKLADIGLMSAVSVTVTQLAGTIGFMPPEFGSGAAEYDKKSRQQSDLYAFGKVIYCTITGRNPNEFPSAQPKKILAEKYYFQLALALSNSKPACRLTDIEKLSKELSAIRRKLESGEKRWDAAMYHWKNFLSAVKQNRKTMIIGSTFLLLLSLCGFFAVKAFQDNEVIITDPVLLCRRLAEGGDANAQYKLAEYYYDGKEVKLDYGEAVVWYRKSAKQGNTEAQYKLGWCYHNGRGVERDLVEAVKWYHKAAERGHIRAQCQLSFCYEKGYGVKKNLVEALNWSLKAAEQGDIRAQYFVAWCYYDGKCVKKDYKEAVKWLLPSASGGDMEAQFLLAVCYYHGRGVAQDYKEAVKWYQLSADQGHASAQFYLGKCYYEGCGVRKSYFEALKLISMSASQGYEKAKKALTEYWKD